MYRWRADQAVNGSISKVHFTSKGRLENKKHLQNFVQQQLMNNNYVDIGEIAGFRKEDWWRKDE